MPEDVIMPIADADNFVSGLEQRITDLGADAKNGTNTAVIPDKPVVKEETTDTAPVEPVDVKDPTVEATDKPIDTTGQPDDTKKEDPPATEGDTKEPAKDDAPAKDTKTDEPELIDIKIGEDTPATTETISFDYTDISIAAGKKIESNEGILDYIKELKAVEPKDITEGMPDMLKEVNRLYQQGGEAWKDYLRNYHVQALDYDPDKVSDEGYVRIGLQEAGITGETQDRIVEGMNEDEIIVQGSQGRLKDKARIEQSSTELLRTNQEQEQQIAAQRQEMALKIEGVVKKTTDFSGIKFSDHMKAKAIRDLNTPVKLPNGQVTSAFMANAMLDKSGNPDPQKLVKLWGNNQFHEESVKFLRNRGESSANKENFNNLANADIKSDVRTTDAKPEVKPDFVSGVMQNILELSNPAA